MSDSKQPNYDPVYLNARRESKFILIAWAAFGIWVVGFCMLKGYDVDPDQMKVVMGMPSWVFWGIALPWFLAALLTVWFSLFYMKDDPPGRGF